MRRGADRSCTTTGWLTSWHSFSYGPWYDPDNVGFGPLVVSNHDVLAPGAGFDEHQHHGVDLVTYVVSGSLAHRDSTGREAVLSAGELQVLRAGAGVTHSERNASSVEPVEYVQMWLRTEDPAVSYTKELACVVLAGCELTVHHLAVGGAVSIDDQVWAHVYLVSGSALLADGARLAAGDAVRGRGDRVELVAETHSRLLAWTWPIS